MGMNRKTVFTVDDPLNGAASGPAIGIRFVTAANGVAEVIPIPKYGRSHVTSVSTCREYPSHQRGSTCIADNSANPPPLTGVIP